MVVKQSSAKPRSRRAKPASGVKSVRRRGGVAKLSRASSALVSKAVRTKGFAEAEIVTRWGRIVGAELARSTVPVRLAFPRGERRGATLHVRAESAFAPVLQQRSGVILELVNRYLGYAAVNRLEVRHGPLPTVKSTAPMEKKPLDAAHQKRLEELVGAKSGELSPLQAAVISLGEFVLSDEQTKTEENKHQSEEK